MSTPNPRRPGRKRKPLPVSLPALSSLPPELRPRVAKARLQALAHPLGFTVVRDHDGVTVEQRTAPVMRPDDRLTPERRRHAEAAELLVVMDVYQTDAGEKTDLKRQRLISPLEQLWKAGVLDSGQYGAARRYQKDADLAAVTGPGSTVRYEPRMIDGGNDRFLLPIEAAAGYLANLARAQLACGPALRKVLDWIATEPMGWRFQAKAWFPAASERHARWMFKRNLRAACSVLETHYR